MAHVAAAGTAASYLSPCAPGTQEGFGVVVVVGAAAAESWSEATMTEGL